jgi:hypothetical protein
MNSQLTKKLQRTLIVFPVIAMVVSVGCVSASGAQPDVSPIAKKTTTTVKRKPPTTTKPPKGTSGFPTALSVWQLLLKRESSHLVTTAPCLSTGQTSIATVALLVKRS